MIATATGSDEAPEPLADDQTATEVRDELPEHRFAEAWVSGEGIDQLLAPGSGTLSTLSPLIAPGSSRGVAASLSADDDGLRALDPERARPRAGERFARLLRPPSRASTPASTTTFRRARVPRVRGPQARQSPRCSHRRARRRPGSRPASATWSRAFGVAPTSTSSAACSRHSATRRRSRSNRPPGAQLGGRGSVRAFRGRRCRRGRGPRGLAALGGSLTAGSRGGAAPAFRQEDGRRSAGPTRSPRRSSSPTPSSTGSRRSRPTRTGSSDDRGRRAGSASVATQRATTASPTRLSLGLTSDLDGSSTDRRGSRSGGGPALRDLRRRLPPARGARARGFERTATCSLPTLGCSATRPTRRRRLPARLRQTDRGRFALTSSAI